MSKHLTVRMAWHDNKWNGQICKDPEGNNYCEGAYSLLSDRLARRKNVDIETDNEEEELDVQYPNYTPPCYWSSNAFSPISNQIVHTHPFRNFEDKQIEEELPAYSVFGWPFRLAFTHSDQQKDRHGAYPPNLEKRAENFFDQFSSGDSIVFFYLNYDNPVSADEYKYALVGCAKLSEIGDATYFNFSESEMEQVRSWGDRNKNFTDVNWARRLSTDFEETGVRLPYHEYLAHAEENPEDEEALREMRVLIEEDALTPRFKYVTEEMESDHCLYLLYKLQKSIKTVQEHDIVDDDFAREEEIIDGLLSEVWERRGLYPGLSSVLDFLIDPYSDEVDQGTGIVNAIQQNLDAEADVLENTVDILDERGIPDHLQEHAGALRKARRNWQNYSAMQEGLKRLSLFQLTPFQLRRILFPEAVDTEADIHPFRGREITPEKIAANPYLLFENYVPITDDDDQEQRERDRFDIRDRPIGLFTIDIGMFPDEEYIEPNYELQNLADIGPERLRALTLEYLSQTEEAGHCFAPLNDVYDYITDHPLFYKQIEDQQLLLRKEQIVSDQHLDHFGGRLAIESDDRTYYFYRQEVKKAEETIENTVDTLLAREPYNVDLTWVDQHVRKESKELTQKIEGFDSERFRTERKQLLTGALRSAFFAITGKPGTGKTFALDRVIQELEEVGEDVTILTPTGKAALRVHEETGKDAETIDRFIYRNGYAELLENFEAFPEAEVNGEPPAVKNLIIDEASMVDLEHFAILFSMLQDQGLASVKRVILVGDVNQLPPIGYGHPFDDLVSYLGRDGERQDAHLVSLAVNCRQRSDRKILEVADLFVGKNRYYSDLLGEIEAGGELSEQLTVEYWEDSNELHQKIDTHLQTLITEQCGQVPDRETGLNRLFDLTDDGGVPGDSAEYFNIDNFQVLTPYRAGGFGTIGLNGFIRREYRPSQWEAGTRPADNFGHADKIIRTTNWYWWGDLRLSNGSIGILTKRNTGWRMYFPDADEPFDYKPGKEDDFELAYALTVHKAQGSEFDNVFVVIPEKRALLSKELVYTALTRSKGALTLFIQNSEGENLLETARNNSTVLSRRTSVLTDPGSVWWILEPEADIEVKSKVEYILYQSLTQAAEAHDLSVQYEQPLELEREGRTIEIKPDFTVEVEGQIYYWEHLGILDDQEYFEDWQNRFELYAANGLDDVLVTTDDLNGIKQNNIESVISDVVSDDLTETTESKFSNHHYTLH